MRESTSVGWFAGPFHASKKDRVSLISLGTVKDPVFPPGGLSRGGSGGSTGLSGDTPGGAGGMG